MESQVDEVKQKIDIVEVIGAYIKLNRAGRNFKGLCPFHNERTPSFTVSPDRGTWRCFGCGEHGDVIAFLEKHDNLTFMEALEQLAKRAGVELHKDETLMAKGKSKQRLYDLLNLAAEYYTYLLTQHDLGKEARAYLAKRQIDDELIKKYRLGFAPDSWQSLQQFLTKKGFSAEEIDQAGMSSSNERGRRYDRFRNRVMFAVTDGMGRVVGFSGRSMDAEAKGAKYLNSPEGPLFHKGRLLFGLSVARESIRAKDRIVLVEGNVDVLSSSRVGVGEVVAPLGTALTEEQAALIKRYTDRVYVAFDNDKAGQEATNKSIHILRNADLDVRIVTLRGGADPDEVVLNDPKMWIQCVEEATEVLYFYLRQVKSKYKTDTEHGLEQAVSFLMPIFLLNVKNKDKEALLYSRIADDLQVKEEVLRSIASRLIREAYFSQDGQSYVAKTRRGKEEGEKEKKKEVKLGRQEILLEYLVSGWLSLPLEQLQAEDFEPMLGWLPKEGLNHQEELIESFRLMVGQKQLSVAEWSKDLSAEAQVEMDRLGSVVMESGLTGSGTIGVVDKSTVSVEQRLAELLEVVREIHRLYLKKQLDTISRSLKQAEALDKQKVLELQQQFIAISQQLSASSEK